MKKTLKILSLIFAVVLIFGTVSVGMTAYAVSDDVLGDYKFEITNPYEHITWDDVTAYKAATHVHCVRSDADTELDDMVHEYYRLGYDAMALTDHGTVNFGWTTKQTRLAIFDYQYFVHGPVDTIKLDDYKNIITGTRERTVAPAGGAGMMEIPLGNEMNGASKNKCHVNSYYASAKYGDLEIDETWPLNAVSDAYDRGAFTHINHVGEWSEGNDNAAVYTESWIRDFASIYEDYCPNRGTRGSAERQAWISAGHPDYAGCIGMELVNTADSRTHNDRRYVYDAILKKLAPKGINVFGFCEDDAHEYSDCDRNAQYFLINNSKDVAISAAEYDACNKTGNGDRDCNYNPADVDEMDRVQNYYRDSMFYGEFYCSSKNSKNTYELGDGFVARGNYPSISDISVDDEKNQISVTYKDATKIRMIADGEVIETYRSDAGQQTYVFDLNRNESKINSYVRIYLTGDGGVTYVQPFLVKKTQATTCTVQFITPSLDTQLTVFDSNGVDITETYRYNNNYFVLPAGTYTYTASRRGYQTKEDQPFEVTAEDHSTGAQKKITVTLDELEDTSYAYFYAPETIYLSPSDNKTFEQYIDRENAVNGELHTDAQSTGNIFFQREGAENIELSYETIEGSAGIQSMSIESTQSAENTLATRITAGQLKNALSNDQYVYIKWTASYTYKGLDYEAYTYSYVYKVPVDASRVVAAGASAETKKSSGWLHSSMEVMATVFVQGIHKLVSDRSVGYKYISTGTTDACLEHESRAETTGTGYLRVEQSSRGNGSYDAKANNTDLAYVYADRSRIDNWSEIPYLKIGLDINTSEEETGEGDSRGPIDVDDSAWGFIRLGFNTSMESLIRPASTVDMLYRVEFSNASNYTEEVEYNGTTKNEPKTASRMLEAFDRNRVYLSDNEVSGKELNKALPGELTQETTVPISAVVKGNKQNRSDIVYVQINLTLVNTNKRTLRLQYNDTVKGCYQEEWFPSKAAWEEYQGTIAKAGKVLGDPTAEIDEIENMNIELQAAIDNFVLKTGTYTVKHYWTTGTESGLIYTETTDSYTYGDSLTANATTISGYDYADYFECYTEDGLAYTKTDDFDNITATKGQYEWRFYYTPYHYNVTYNSNGAADVTGYDAVAYFGRPYTVLATAPQRTGYTFNGWLLDNTQKNYSAGEVFQWNYAGDGEFVAYWSANTYNVSYDVNGGNPIVVDDRYKTVEYDETYSICPEVPTMTGYSFLGWTLNGEGDAHAAGSNFQWKIASDATFVAKWGVAKYEVIFDKVIDDDSIVLSEDSKMVEFGEPYGTLATAERTGYTIEWYSDPSYPSVSRITETTEVEINDNHTLYAKWVPINYTITYNLGGGTVVGNNPATYNIESGAITLKQPTRIGYTFLGWSGADFTGTKPNYTIPAGSTGNKTFTANWSKDTYTITYNGMEGAVNDPNNRTTFGVEDSFTIYAPTKTGYRFTGWTGSNGSSAELEVSVPANTHDNLVYEAHWVLLEYTITYSYGTSNPPTNPETYTVETAEFSINNPTKTGYTFQYWTCNNSLFDNKTDITITPGSVTGNLTFEANWAENGAHTVTYVLNGGRVEGTNRASYKVGDSFTLINPTRAGYTFSGWKKTINGSTSGLTTEASVLSTDDADVKFEAFWNRVDYTITYNLGGGFIPTAGSNPTSYNAESSAITLINPIRTGYTFSGWMGTDLTSARSVVTIPTGSSGNRNYSATWSENEYTVTYDFNGGTDTGLLTKYRTTTNDSITAPYRAGYTFTGWNVAFSDFDWKAGTISSSGKFAEQANSYYSDGVVLRAGNTYELTSPVTGLKIYTFAKDGTFKGEISNGTVTPDVDVTAYIVAAGQSSANALTTVKLSLTGSTPTTFAIEAETDSKLGNAGNMLMTANWVRDSYTITYAGCSGATWGVDDGNNVITENPNPTGYTYDSRAILLENPSKTGCTFRGWEYDGVVSTSTTIPAHSTGNRTYTALWETTTYRITYSGVNGATWGVDGDNNVIAENPNPTTYSIDSESITVTNPEKTGYTFSGWSGTDITGTSQNVVIASGSTGNRNYTATWTPVSYTITYSGIEGATVNNVNSYTIETNTFTLNNPTKAGSVFEGWQENGSESTLSTVTIAKGSTGNKAFTAVWSYPDFSITYNLAGGVENTNPSTYKVTSADITLNMPTRDGYTFAGWTGTNIEEITQAVLIKSGSIGNRNYIAHWNPINYTINYDLDGGAVPQNANPTLYTIESATINLVNPVKNGYAFTGWTGTGLSENTMEVSIPRGSMGNRSYTATWSENSFEITYKNIEGATFTSANRTSYTPLTETFVLNNPVKRGYHFDGWSGTDISGSGISDNVTVIKGSTGNRSYTANWTIEDYTITYNLNGGTAGGINNPTSYNVLSAPFAVYPPTRVGYTFTGWSSDYFDGTEASVTIDPNETPTGDKTLTAQWEEAVYTVTLNPNGGTLPGDQPATFTYEYDSAPITLKNPTPAAGYEFAGWTGTGLSGKVKTVTIPTNSTGNRTYTAIWTSSSANVITYELAGGEVPEGANPETYATNSGTITLVNPTKGGYKFTGWTSDDSIVIIRGKIAQISTAAGGSAYVEATWEPIEYKITYNLNGGSVSGSNPTTYTIEDSFSLNNPVRPGYTFAGWTGTDLDDTKQNTNVSVSNKTGIRTYTANWTEAEYTITYNYNGGSLSNPNPTSYNVLTPVFTLNNPVKSGYTFTGWSGTDISGTKNNVTIVPSSATAKNLSFTANFEIDSYSIDYYGVDGDDVTFSTTHDSYKVTDETFTLDEPTRTGYTFKGWMNDDFLDPQKNVEIAKGSTGNREYTAIWEETVYDITYNLDGGTVAGTNPATYTVESAKITLLNPTKNGYVFAGWNTSDGDKNVMIAEIAKGSTGDKTFTANWTTAPYTISYPGLTAAQISDMNLPTVYYSNSATTIPNAAMAGYTFDGWTGTDFASPTKNIVLPVGTTGNKTFRANWTMVEYKITYNYADGEPMTSNPTKYTVDSADITLTTPVKTGYAFLGWTGSNGATPQKNVVIKTGSTGDRSYTANWTPRAEGATHRIYFRGLNNTKLYINIVKDSSGNITAHYDYIELPVGEKVTEEINSLVLHPENIDVTAGYQITGWDIDFNADKYSEVDDDIYVNAVYATGPDRYTVQVNNSSPYTTTCGQYERVTVSADYQNAAGELFSHWVANEVDDNGNIISGQEVTSYYRNYTFYAHSNVVLIACYGGSSSVRATTRISRIEEYDPNYDWITPNSERSVATELSLIQQGIIFTTDASLGGSENAFIIGATGVYNGVANTKSASNMNLTGTWALSIPNPNFLGFGETVYFRSYVKVVDESGTVTTKYSAIRTYINNQDTTDDSKKGA